SYACSLLGLNQGVRDVPSYLRAAAIVDTVFRENPNHPGAAHLLIHSYDDPIHAPLGLAAARAYSKIAPDAAHAQHMTTHIFLALGMWDEVVSQNELASGRDHAAWTPHHYTQWLGYGYLQQGRYADAFRHLQRMHENMNQSRRGRAVVAQMRAEYVVNTEQWDSPCLQWSIDLSTVRSRDAAVDGFVGALSALKRGDRADAGRRLVDLATLNRNRAPPEAGVVAARPRPRGRRGRRPSHGSPRLPRAAGDLAWVRPESPRTRGGDPVSRGEALRSGLRPDGDDAAAGVAPEELARRFRRAAVNLDALNVLGRRVAREVGRRLVAVEKILRVGARRRPDHLGDTRVRDAHLLHAAHRDQDIDEGGRPGALDLLLGEEIAHPRVPATLEVREPPSDGARLPFDHDP